MEALEPYQGILMIAKDAVTELGGGRGEEIWDVRLVKDRLTVVWDNGKEGKLSCAEVLERAKLTELPPPSVAFVSEHDHIGLLFTSSSPHRHLRFREPHSVVMTLGTLTRGGLEPPP